MQQQQQQEEEKKASQAVKGFDKLKDLLHPDLLNSLQNKFEMLTDLQEKTLVHSLKYRQKKDNVAEFGQFILAPTGSGKTLCFSIPAVQSIDLTKPTLEQKHVKPSKKAKNQTEFTAYTFYPQVIIVLESQALINQVYDVITKQILPSQGPLSQIVVEKLYGDHFLLRNDNQGQIKGHHILLVTPEKFSKQTQMMPNATVPTRIVLDNLKIFIIDEVDQIIKDRELMQIWMMGQKEYNKQSKSGDPEWNNVAKPIREIIDIQVIFASATIEKRIQNDIQMMFYKDHKIKLWRRITINQNPGKVYHFAKQLKSNRAEESLPELINILKIHYTQNNAQTQVMVFLQSKALTNEVIKILEKDKLLESNINFAAYHSEIKDKDRVLEQYRKGEIQVLFCTEVLARGIDIKNVVLVVNLQAPKNISYQQNNQVSELNCKTYLHSVGRTGRFDDQGVSLVMLLGDSKDNKKGENDRDLPAKYIEYKTRLQLDTDPKFSEMSNPEKNQNQDYQNKLTQLLVDYKEKEAIKLIENKQDEDLFWETIDKVTKYNQNSQDEERPDKIESDVLVGVQEKKQEEEQQQQKEEQQQDKTDPKDW